jgi:hypothetical protein
MSIVGITASKDFLYLAMTTGQKAHFLVTHYHRILVDANDWPSFVATLSTHLSSYNAQDNIQCVAVACCASGRYGASPEAFKAEGFAELKSQELGYIISSITKQGLLKHIGCPSGQRWQDYAKQLFNAQKQIKHFSSGYDAAISAAYGVAP